MNITILQFNSIWQDTQRNLSQLQQVCEPLYAHDDCDLLVLPETFHAGFSMNPSLFAESVEGEISQALSKLAQKLHCHVLAGVAQKQIRTRCQEQQVNYFNRALCFDSQGQQIAAYTKQKLFSYAGEDQVFQAGFKPEIVTINSRHFALFICYDLRFPELFRGVATEVDGFIIIANWPSSRQLHWESLLKARAIENQCFVIAVNRIGEDDNGLSYHGGSTVISPLGKVAAYGERNETLVQVDIDLSEVEKVRKQFPFLLDK